MTAPASTHPIRSASVRRWLTGLGISLIGDQVYFIALAWSAVQVAGPGVAGLILAAGAVPRAVLMLLGGVVVDRLGARRVLLGSDGVRIVIMILLAAALTYTDLQVAALLVVSIAFGIVDALFYPAAGALPPLLVPAAQLLPLQGLRAFVYRAAVLVGAPLGGFFVAGLGAASAMLFNAATFVVSLTAVATLRLIPARSGATPRPPTSYAQDLRAGLRHARANAVVLPTVGVLFGVELGLGGTLNLGLPLLTRYHHWPATHLGLLVGGFGFGAAIAALATATFRVSPKRPTLPVCGLLCAVGIATLPWVNSPWVAACVTAVIGATAAIVAAVALALVQANTDSAHLGRIMSLCALATIGSQPLANALTGMIAAGSTVLIALLVNATITATGAACGLFIRTRRAAGVGRAPFQVRDESRAGSV